ncbi:MAG: hypothetical protein WC465_00935 [Patescibacteria group bacterium]
MKNNIFIIIIILALIASAAFYFLRNKKPPINQSDKNNSKNQEVYCTAEVKECPDGSFVGRVPPACEFAPCPGDTTPTNWLSYTDTDREKNISFRYPKDLGKKYIFTEDWPPIVSVINQPYTCQPTDQTSSLAARTIERKINNRTYCIAMSSEGAVGSVYTSYRYTTPWKSKLLNITFTLRYPQCQNYFEPEQTACVDERQDFDIDALVDQIISSVSSLKYP